MMYYALYDYLSNASSYWLCWNCDNMKLQNEQQQYVFFKERCNLVYYLKTIHGKNRRDISFDFYCDRKASISI